MVFICIYLYLYFVILLYIGESDLVSRIGHVAAQSVLPTETLRVNENIMKLSNVLRNISFNFVFMTHGACTRKEWNKIGLASILFSLCCCCWWCIRIPHPSPTNTLLSLSSVFYDLQMFVFVERKRTHRLLNSCWNKGRFLSIFVNLTRQ